MKNWKKRFSASGLHLIVSVCMAALAAWLVFGLWYPYPYREISGGRQLFLLVIFVDVVIGPMITLIIFNSDKPRRELFIDVTVVGALQLAALAYGLWAVFIARPVHLVFEYSRFTVVHAVDIEPKLLEKAPIALQSLPLRGPTSITLRPFRDAGEQLDATVAALQGGAPLAARSDLWQSYEAGATSVLKASKPVAELKTRFPDHVIAIQAVATAAGRDSDKLRYLPMVGRDKAWTALIDGSSAQPIGFLPLDSF